MKTNLPARDTSSAQSDLRRLPAVETLLRSKALSATIALYTRPLVTEAARHILAGLRQQLRDRQELPISSVDDIGLLITQYLSEEWPGFAQTVINATGIVLHTNLGRAPLSNQALDAIRALGSRYFNLEIDLQSGTRGERTSELRRLLAISSGAEDALVVNNNAAAMLLIMVTLAKNKETIISRGELVQIGSGFRIPEILEQSGVVLHEIGTTNQTSLDDYERAINKHTGLILKVHQSNFTQKGFVSQTSIAELHTVANKANLPLVCDLGNGLLLNTADFGLQHEPTVMDTIRSGADIVCFSGDKLLGGPQAGIIVGKRKYIRLMLNHPLLRVIRLDKLSAIALETTIKSYLSLNAKTDIPVWQMIGLEKESIHKRARAIVRRLKTRGLDVSIQKGESLIGGGTLPEQSLPTTLIRLNHNSKVDEISRRLRLASPPMVARVVKNAILIDLRTVYTDQDALLPDIITAAVFQKD